ncbi:MAG: molecular chaperone TorD family protein [Planctomycetes bacterium]|nr:molecular chaperone TorD family protein [Planctomycetota bacterium]
MNTESAVLPDKARAAVARAADLRLIGLLLASPSVENRRQVDELRAEAPDEALRALAGQLRALDDGYHGSLFGPGGPVSPREAAYIGRQDPARVMAELGSFYAAFGFRPPAADPVDHVATEVAFASFLSLKEGYALSRGDAAAARTTAEALHHFFREHLSVIAGGLVARFTASPEVEFLALANALLARSGGLPLKEEQLVSLEDEDVMSCGMCEGEDPKDSTE